MARPLLHAASAFLLLCCFGVGVLSGGPAIARTLRFDRISLEQGLSQASVKCIFQDKLGLLWIGTDEGLNRFDGYRFTSYRPQPGVADSLADGNVTAVVEDSLGQMWVGTDGGGLDRFDAVRGTFTHHRHAPEGSESLASDTVTALLVDRKGNVRWLHRAYKPGDENEYLNQVRAMLREPA